MAKECALLRGMCTYSSVNKHQFSFPSARGEWYWKNNKIKLIQQSAECKSWFPSCWVPGKLSHWMRIIEFCGSVSGHLASRVQQLDFHFQSLLSPETNFPPQEMRYCHMSLKSISVLYNKINLKKEECGEGSQLNYPQCLPHTEISWHKENA